MKDTREELSTLTVGLHWLVAAAIIGMLAFGLYIDSLERSPERGALMDLHKSIGVTILALACLRILWRWRNGMPVMLGRAPRWHKVAAHAVHGLLLLATVLMPLTGIMMSLGGGHGLALFGLTLVAEGAAKQATIAAIGESHGTIAWILIGVIALHVAAALKHQVIDRDGTLRRMLGRRIAG
jgi:cytochrome b561